MKQRAWLTYDDNYRSEEVAIIASWIKEQLSGSVVGLPGCGRSNLLGFLCHRPNVLNQYLSSAGKVALVAVDLNSLPASDLATLYRVILRAFYRGPDSFNSDLQQKITRLYQKNEAVTDPFLPQSALQELLQAFQEEAIQVVLVFNRFNHFCELATPRMVNTLRSLRDDFKDTLTYIAGMPQEIAYLPNRERLGNMYELLDNDVCWVGAMNKTDSRRVVQEELREMPAPEEVEEILALTGGFPALLKAVCRWWQQTTEALTPKQKLTRLINQKSVIHRLDKIWAGLTQEEQFLLAELQKRTSKKTEKFVKPHRALFNQLAQKGVCRQKGASWVVNGQLLDRYIADIAGRSRGKIWLDEDTGEMYQGQTLVPDLTDLELAVLIFLVKNPYQRHTKTNLIFETWPDDLRQNGVSDDSLYQIIAGIRKKIEPFPSTPTHLLTWRGKPEGGYQFYPEGRPAG